MSSDNSLLRCTRVKGEEDEILLKDGPSMWKKRSVGDSFSQGVWRH